MFCFGSYLREQRKRLWSRGDWILTAGHSRSRIKRNRGISNWDPTRLSTSVVLIGDMFPWVPRSSKLSGGKIRGSSESRCSASPTGSPLGILAPLQSPSGPASAVDAPPARPAPAALAHAVHRCIMWSGGSVWWLSPLVVHSPFSYPSFIWAGLPCLLSVRLLLLSFFSSLFLHHLVHR